MERKTAKWSPHEAVAIYIEGKGKASSNGSKTAEIEVGFIGQTHAVPFSETATEESYFVFTILI